MKKTTTLFFGGALLLSPILVATTISCSSSKTQNQSSNLNSHIGAFNIQKISNVDISSVLASDIDDEEELKKYFLFVNYDPENFKYNFYFNVDKNDKSKLNVNVIISHQGEQQSKLFVLDGFKVPLGANEILNSAVSSFDIIKKADISDVLASEIKNENDLKKYFELVGMYPEYTYSFKTISVFNKNDLRVTYNIYLSKNNQLTREKTITLVGFKKSEIVEDKLNNAFSEFNIVLKSNKSVSGTLASEIKEKKDVEKYFNLVGVNFEEGFNYSLNSVKQNENYTSKLDVVYEISYRGMSKLKTITLDGFNPTNNQEDSYNWKEKEEKYNHVFSYYLDENSSENNNNLNIPSLNIQLLNELRNDIFTQAGEDGFDENGNNIYAWEVSFPKSGETGDEKEVKFTKTNHVFTKTYGNSTWKFEVYTVTVSNSTTVTLNFDKTNIKTFEQLGYRTDFIIDLAYGSKVVETTQKPEELPNESKQRYQKIKSETTK